MKFGKTKTLVPIEIKNGARYTLILQANITIPDLIIENVTDVVDFGRVLCGQRKTIFIRLFNEKEVHCDWSLNTRAELNAGEKDKKEGKNFDISPTSGSIPSG